MCLQFEAELWGKSNKLINIVGLGNKKNCTEYYEDKGEPAYDGISEGWSF